MRILQFIIKGAALTVAAVIVLAMLGIGPLAIGYAVLSLADVLAVLPAPQ